VAKKGRSAGDWGYPAQVVKLFRVFAGVKGELSGLISQFWRKIMRRPDWPRARVGQAEGPLVSRADPGIVGCMAESRKMIWYALDVLIVLVPLAIVIYFISFPDKFDAFLAWLVRTL
jgi:hypothetical protein